MLGFGTFKLVHREARSGRNPATGEPIDIKEGWTPAFSASRVMKDTVNEHMAKAKGNK
jgi:nucleoid DNA-binding protein